MGLRLLLVLAALMVLPTAWAAKRIAPDHAQLQYTGRIDDSVRRAPVLSWPGTAIAGRFSGTSLALAFDDQRGKNYYNVFIDGDSDRPLILRLDRGSKTYLVAKGLAPGEHSFLVTKRTEGYEGATVFQGLTLDDKADLLPPPPRPARRIEFFGDSITSGTGADAPIDGDDDFSKDKNNYRTYAAVAARRLGAEAHFTAQDGIGIMVSWPPFTMPDFYDQLSAVGDNDSRWDFARWTPDVVVINLLQNDSWLIDREHRLRPVPSDAARVAAYQAFLARIRRHYPNAYIVCALGSMDATRPGSKWPGYITAAVANLRRAGDARIDTLFFPFTGYEKHPRAAQHAANGEQLAAFIRLRMGW